MGWGLGWGLRWGLRWGLGWRLQWGKLLLLPDSKGAVVGELLPVELKEHIAPEDKTLLRTR